jgi:GT2 family glycosyltransferase
MTTADAQNTLPVAPEEGAEAPVHEGAEILRMPREAKLVSVIIVSYECKDALLECLASLEREKASLPLEVIVIDNDSRDGTPYAVGSRFPWVKLVVNRKNVGFARAANQGMRFARGEYLLFLNPDTVVSDGTIAATVAEVERHPDVGMLGCKLVRSDGSFDHACKRSFPTIAGAIYYFTGLTGARPSSRRFAQYTAGHLGVDETGFIDAVNGAFMLVRRDAANDVGVMDERYWLYAEDLDWCHRFWSQGWKILYWPAVEVIHLKGASAGDHRSLKLNFAFHKSIWLFYAKHHAPHRSPLLSAFVWFGVWSKFLVSALTNHMRRSRTRSGLAREQTLRAPGN